jgi:hypothetical protein
VWQFIKDIVGIAFDPEGNYTGEAKKSGWLRDYRPSDSPFPEEPDDEADDSSEDEDEVDEDED